MFPIYKLGTLIYKYKKQMIYFRLIFIFILIDSCNLIPSNSEYILVNATAIFPRINMSSGKLLGYDTTVTQIVQKDDIVLYKILYKYDSLKLDTIISESRCHYIVYKRGDRFGYNYDIHKSSKGQKVNLDSILKYEWFIQNKLYPIFGSINEVKLLSTYKSSNSDTLKERYSIISKVNPGHSGLAFLEFCNSLNGINFSLSKELDSLKNMKLYKFRTQYNPIKVSDTVTIDKFETAYEIKVSKQIDKEIISYFKKFSLETKK